MSTYTTRPRVAHPDSPTGSFELWTEVEELTSALGGQR